MGKCSISVTYYERNSPVRKHFTVKVCVHMEANLHAFLTLALDVGMLQPL
jgi:hypothetical protein